MKSKMTEQDKKDAPRLMHCCLVKLKVVDFEYFGGRSYTLECIGCRKRFKVELLNSVETGERE